MIWLILTLVAMFTAGAAFMLWYLTSDNWWGIEKWVKAKTFTTKGHIDVE